MKLSTKLLGGFSMLTIMVLVGGLAGTYGVNQLDKSIDFITTDAWSTTDGSSKGTIGVYQELLAVSEILLERGDIEGGAAREIHGAEMQEGAAQGAEMQEGAAHAGMKMEMELDGARDGNEMK